MSLVKCSDIKDLVYSYLGYRGINSDLEIDSLILECFSEVEELSQFRYMMYEYTEIFDFLKRNESYQKLLNNCSSYLFVITTLGSRIDDRCKYYSKTNMKKMCVFDAVASAYLEALADKYEADYIKSPHTYRFCPGYQNTSVEDLREIFKIIKPFKLGISLLDSNLMIPLKTMCGIIALGKTSKKECGHCAIKDKCEYRKKGKTCF